MLREATEDDVNLMLSWRNQETNRQVSKTSHRITAEEHAAWWARVRADPAHRILMYVHDGLTAGVVTFSDLRLDGPRTASWGFYLDADGLAGRGATLPAWLGVMRAAVDYAFDVLALDRLDGEVLAHNTVVRQMNRRFRFVEGTVGRASHNGREVDVVPISLTRENRRRR
ncbi:GNAT family N-acetyltransferase [Micromonospora rifamycinica]|uniref:Protein N-acetyltransferase, RimJ/RimL family n=1 Tax=Micromonospora rifamycinica TaxID=291594 RepID=A0A109II28_9ACTN|nr:GNAT family N-acetyltransferase [Micromonospora rifamycinica]KWV30959.1 peptide chain release factor 2 [Micromonospora rifamycinica]SCG50472.1 Protein N-acetyltransferase, RimJ/RimL family [Micromonospora rifamycinica]